MIEGKALRDLMCHRPPMLLLQRLVEIGLGYAVCEVRISPRSTFYQTSLGVPTWVGIEYMAQTVAVIAGARDRADGGTVRQGYLLGTRRYHCARAWFEAGCRLLVRCHEQAFDENGLGAYNCVIEDDVVLAEARLTVYLGKP